MIRKHLQLKALNAWMEYVDDRQVKRQNLEAATHLWRNAIGQKACRTWKSLTAEHVQLRELRQMLLQTWQHKKLMESFSEWKVPS